MITIKEAVVMKNGDVLGWNIRVADSFWRRLIGLWGKRWLREGEGLLLSPCRQVHTWFMLFPIDVVFIDKSGKIVDLKDCLAPWKVSPYAREGYHVLELPAGTIKKHVLKKNEVLDLLYP